MTGSNLGTQLRMARIGPGRRPVPLRAVVVGAYDAEARAWSREERDSLFGGPISSPTVSASAGSGAYVAWLCEAPVVDLVGSASCVSFELQSADGVSEAGVKFLAGAACEDGTVYVMTAYCTTAGWPPT
jgi:hypothetical protein